MKLLVSTLTVVLTWATGALAAPSALNGKTFYSSADCGIANAWPTATAGAAEIRDCDITLAVTASGEVTYTTTARHDLFQGFAEDVTLNDGSKVTGLFFSNLNGNYIPVVVAADGNSIEDTSAVLTLSVTKPTLSILLDRTFTTTADCGVADSWYLNDGLQHAATGTDCTVTLAFDGTGHYTYTTDNGSHTGNFQQRAQIARLTWDTLPAGRFYPFHIASDNNSLTLVFDNGETMVFTAK